MKELNLAGIKIVISFKITVKNLYERIHSALLKNEEKLKWFILALITN